MSDEYSGRLTHRLLVGLDEELFMWLKAEAARQSTSMSRLIREAVVYARNSPFGQGSDAGSSGSVGV
jgi:hypothetical protein